MRGGRQLALRPGAAAGDAAARPGAQRHQPQRGDQRLREGRPMGPGAGAPPQHAPAWAGANPRQLQCRSQRLRAQQPLGLCVAPAAGDAVVWPGARHRGARRSRQHVQRGHVLARRPLATPRAAEDLCHGKRGHVHRGAHCLRQRRALAWGAGALGGDAAVGRGARRPRVPRRDPRARGLPTLAPRAGAPEGVAGPPCNHRHA
mmetsp:Transcript_1261/g.3912  ORF Transcript_1261/g.3912 Transcript_1261/m.3912 type:complete len:203 (-) Transcript_1261:138-746(-)